MGVFKFVCLKIDKVPKIASAVLCDFQYSKTHIWKRKKIKNSLKLHSFLKNVSQCVTKELPSDLVSTPPGFELFYMT